MFSATEIIANNGADCYASLENAGEGMFPVVFDPPNGDVVKYFGTGIACGQGSLVFDVQEELLTDIFLLVISFNIDNSDDDRAFLSLSVPH